MDKMPDFSSIEEIKSYLNSTEAEHSAVVILDENNKPMTVPFKALVEKIGIDAAAEFIYSTQGKGEKYGLSKDEYFALKEKAFSDPESLTLEEKRLFVIGHTVFESEEFNKHTGIMHDITAVIVKTFMELESTNTYGAMLAIFLTIAEGLLITSSEKISSYHENEAIYKEVLTNARAKISFPEDMDDELLLLALLETIGQRFVARNNHVAKMEAQYEALADALGLNEEIIHDKVDGSFGKESSENEKVFEENDKTADVRKRMKGLS